MRFHTYDGSKTATAGAAASEITLDMTPGRQYELRAHTADVWFRIVIAGAAGAAIAGDGSHFLPAGQAVKVAAIGSRVRVSVIRAAAADATVILSETPEVHRT